MMISTELWKFSHTKAVMLQSTVRPPHFPLFTSLYLYYGLPPSSGLTALRHCLNPSIPISIDLTPCYYFAIPFPLFPFLVGPLEPTIYINPCTSLSFLSLTSAEQYITLYWLISLVEV